MNVQAGARKTPGRADTPVDDAVHEAAWVRDAAHSTEGASLASATDAPKPTLPPVALRYNKQLLQYTASRQYESSVLPGRQLGLALPPSPSTPLQQRQRRYDGQVEADDATR